MQLVEEEECELTSPSHLRTGCASYIRDKGCYKLRISSLSSAMLPVSGKVLIRAPLVSYRRCGRPVLKNIRTSSKIFLFHAIQASYGLQFSATTTNENLFYNGKLNICTKPSVPFIQLLELYIIKYSRSTLNYFICMFLTHFFRLFR